MSSENCTSHYHITLDCGEDKAEEMAKILKSKVTVIGLKRGARIAVDVMLTRYQKGVSLDNLLADVNIITRHKIPVIRYKLERNLANLKEAFNVKVSDENYVEIHAAFKELLQSSELFTLPESTNRKHKDIFRNFRARNQEQVKEAVRLFELHEEKCHIEYTVYDSNKNYDRWWA